MKTTAKVQSFEPGTKKLLASLEEAIEKSGLKDGMTISFHHHLRNGDQVVNLVTQAIAARGSKTSTWPPQESSPSMSRW